MRRIEIAFLLLLCSCGAVVRSGPEAEGLLQKHAPAQSPAVLARMMVPVHSPAGAFLIDRYEVSELAPGEFFSARNQTPRTGITHAHADRICRENGKQLCTDHQWKGACLGAQAKPYGYAKLPVPGRCNVKSDSSLATGYKGECATDAGVQDMIGNVMEWVDAGGRPAAMGGSYLSGESDADCFSVLFFPPNTANTQIGFRCCAQLELQP